MWTPFEPSVTHNNHPQRSFTKKHSIQEQHLKHKKLTTKWTLYLKKQGSCRINNQLKELTAGSKDKLNPQEMLQEAIAHTATEEWKGDQVLFIACP